MEIGVILGGVLLVIGWALFVWAYRSKVLWSQKAERAESELAQVRFELEAQKKAALDTEKNFKAIASDIINQNSEAFLKLANERLDKKTAEADGVFEKKVLEFKQLLEPLATTMQKMESDLRGVEKQREQHYGQLAEQILKMSKTSESLRKEASELASALRRPGVKGSWGEFQLRRVVELAGMSSYCDFDEQVQTKSKDSRLRPDMIINLPNKRMIVVDSKVVSEAYHEAMNTSDEKLRRTALEKHAKDLRAKFVELSRKSYWEQFDQSPEFAVLFVPTESLLYAAAEVDPKLIEDAMREKVVIASPTNLVALLKAVAYGWQQNELTENAEKVFFASKDLYERVAKWTEHMGAIGKGLEGAIKAYNNSVGSLEARVLPAARKMNELGLRVEEMASPTMVERPLRELKSTQNIEP